MRLDRPDRNRQGAPVPLQTMATMIAMPSRKIEVALAAARRALESPEVTASAAAAAADVAAAEDAAQEVATADLTRVCGLGPARARQLYRELGVSTVEELDQALSEGRVTALRGFSTMLEKRLRMELDGLLRPCHRLLLPDAEVPLRRLLEYMQRAPGIEHVEVAGSYRRRCPTLGDIDVLAVSGRPAAVMRYFTTYADAASATSVDATRGALMLNCGLRVELRIVPRRCFGATLHYLTGSIGYNQAVRALGLQQGVRVSEYGVFGLAEGKAGARRLGGQREEDVFDALGMQWLPPELREDRGEIEAAVGGRVPALATLEDVRGDLAVRALGGGPDRLEAMLNACLAAGYGWCGVAAAVTPGAGHGARSLRARAAELESVRGRVGGIDVLYVADTPIRADGSVDVADDERGIVDLVVGWLRPVARRGSPVALDGVIAAIRSGAIDVLAAPPCNAGGEAGAGGQGDADWGDVLRAAAEQDVALLVGGEAALLEHAAEHSRRARELNVRVALATQATAPHDVALMRFVVDQARRGWLGRDELLNSLDPGALRRWLRRRRGVRA
jgi:DNA polymerase (family X)